MSTNSNGRQLTYKQVAARMTIGTMPKLTAMQEMTQVQVNNLLAIHAAMTTARLNIAGNDLGLCLMANHAIAR